MSRPTGCTDCAYVCLWQEIEASIRGEFSTTEVALQSLFDVLQYTSTIIFSEPYMFKYPVLISCVAVAAALVVYASFVRKRRGHLIHLYEKIWDRENQQTRI